MLGIFITAGYPDRSTTVEALKVLDSEGVELIELGVPFSDPLADGPAIQNASFKALEQGTNLDEVFSIYKEADISTKTILFSYYNPLHAYGFDRVIEKCKETGISGTLIPDLPVDEAEDLVTKFREAGLDLVLLAAITSTDDRLKKIAELSSPFVYLVSRVGVTGSSDEAKSLKGDAAETEGSNEVLKSQIAKLREYGAGQVAIGFGIDSADKVSQTLELADMAIVGSKAIKVLEQEGSTGLQKFVAGLKQHH